MEMGLSSLVLVLCCLALGQFEVSKDVPDSLLGTSEAPPVTRNAVVECRDNCQGALLARLLSSVPVDAEQKVSVLSGQLDRERLAQSESNSCKASSIFSLLKIAEPVWCRVRFFQSLDDIQWELYHVRVGYNLRDIGEEARQYFARFEGFADSSTNEQTSDGTTTTTMTTMTTTTTTTTTTTPSRTTAPTLPLTEEIPDVALSRRIRAQPVQSLPMRQGPRLELALRSATGGLLARENSMGMMSDLRLRLVRAFDSMSLDIETLQKACDADNLECMNAAHFQIAQRESALSLITTLAFPESYFGVVRGGWSDWQVLKGRDVIRSTKNFWLKDQGQEFQEATEALARNSKDVSVEGALKLALQHTVAESHVSSKPYAEEAAKRLLLHEECGWDRACKANAASIVFELGRQGVPYFEQSVVSAVENLNFAPFFERKLCFANCNVEFAKFANLFRQVTFLLSSQIDAANVLRYACRTENCRNKTVGAYKARVFALQNVSDRFADMLLPRVELVYSVFGMTINSLLLLACAVFAVLCLMFRRFWTSLRMPAVLVAGVAVTCTLRLAWWILLYLPLSITTNDAVNNFGKFFFGPTVAVGLMGFLIQTFFVLLWSSALMELFEWKRENILKGLKVILICLMLTTSVYCIFVIGWYIAKYNFQELVNSLRFEGDSLNPLVLVQALPEDQSALLLSSLNLVTSAVLAVACVAALWRLSSKSAVSAVIKFGTVAAVMFLAAALKFAYAVAVAAGADPSLAFTFGANFLAAETLFFGVTVVFCFLALFATVKKFNPDMETETRLLSESSEEIPAQYQDY